MIHQFLCNSIKSCLECVLANCHWIEGGINLPAYNCIILQQLSRRPLKIVSPLATERCPIRTTTPNPLDIELINGQVTLTQLLGWILGILVLVLFAIAVRYVVFGWRWIKDRRNQSRYRCREVSRSPPRERPLDSSAPRLTNPNPPSTANAPSTSQGFRSVPEAAPPDRARLPTSEESLREDQEEARRIGREIRALSLPSWFSSAGNNAVGAIGRGTPGAMELHQVDEEAVDLDDDDEGEEQQQGLGLGNVVARAIGAVGGVVRLLGKPFKKVALGGLGDNGVRYETNVEILGYNPRLAYDPRYPHLPHAPIPNSNLPRPFSECRPIIVPRQEQTNMQRSPYLMRAASARRRPRRLGIDSFYG